MAMKIIKLDGVDVPVMGCATVSETPDLWLFGTSPIRVGAVFNYRGKDYS